MNEYVKGVESALNLLPRRLQVKEPRPPADLLPTAALGGFIDLIGLRADVRSNVESEIENLGVWARTDTVNLTRGAQPFAYGAFAQGALTGPGPGGDVLVDVAVPVQFDERDGNGPNAVSLLRSALGASPAYAGRLQKTPARVRIRCSENVHLDVVPVRLAVEGAPLRLQDGTTDRWESFDPKGLDQWVLRSGGPSNALYRRQVLQAFHWWRGFKFSARRAPSWRLLSALVASSDPEQVAADDTSVELYFPQDPNIFSYLVDTANLLFFALADPIGPPPIWNPALPEGGEDLARHWDAQDFDLFVNRMAVLSERLEKAYLSSDLDESLALLRSQFGSTFPMAPERAAVPFV